jgi:DNA mismatch repair protein MSH2
LPAADKSTEYEADKLSQLIERCGVVITERKKSLFCAISLFFADSPISHKDGRKGEFTAKNVEQDLNRLISGDLVVTSRRELR